MARIKLYTVVTPQLDFIGLNQVISFWEEKGWIERITIPMKPDRRFISWVGRKNGLALEPGGVESISDPYEYVLACQYRASWKKITKCLPWNFYVRSWSDYAKVRSELPLAKTNKSIFSGTIRGTVHHRNIWINSTEIFSYSPARTYNKTNRLYPTLQDYYRALAKTKFGLCPTGDCGTCQRDIETMGLGCVPIYTPGVEWEYYVSPQENIHFIFANNPEEMHKKIDNMSDGDREELARNGMKYFNDYCSPTGLWNSVLGTIEKHNIKVD
jgi:hypothetical protein